MELKAEDNKYSFKILIFYESEFKMIATKI